MQAAGRVKRKFAMKALPDGRFVPILTLRSHNADYPLSYPDEHPHFLRYATERAATLRHTIFGDRVVYPFASRIEVLELLEEHITENIVKASS